MFRLFSRKRKLARLWRKSRKHLLLIPLIFLLLAVIGFSCFYAYLHALVYKNLKTVDTWKAAVSAAGDSSSASSGSSQIMAGETGLDELDAGDFLKVQKKDYPIIKVKQKDPDIENILIIGIDGGNPGGVGQNRADSILIASVNTRNNTLKLSSLMRDTKTYFPNTGTWHKLNAAYSYGGVGLQVDVINYAYKLDIQKYILFDFSGFENVINLVGGVPVTLSAKEASYSFINVGTAGGIYDLNGLQALGYVRTRKIDTDFLRTQRQRNVMLALYNKFRDKNMQEKLAAANACKDDFQTNIPTGELFGNLLSFESEMSSTIGQIEIPSEDDGMYATETSPIWYWDLDWSKEVPKLQNFIYGT